VRGEREKGRKCLRSVAEQKIITYIEDEGNEIYDGFIHVRGGGGGIKKAKFLLFWNGKFSCRFEFVLCVFMFMRVGGEKFFPNFKLVHFYAERLFSCL
jgi:hypothetical protein